MRHMSITAAILIILARGLASVQQAPTPVLHEAFEDGPIAGPVGKAAKRFTFNPRGIVNMERGTIAFFVQSERDPQETEWDSIADMRTDRDAGYWSMAMHFGSRRRAFVFNLFDIGGYSPPMTLPSVFGRWKAGQWHHLAATWDRNEGVSVYEDGKLVKSNWGVHRWEWNVLPRTFTIAKPVDEVLVFDVPLTEPQVAQLALGSSPTGAPIALTLPETRRANDLARMGWFGENLGNMPSLTPDKPQAFTFARINGCMDAKRPVAYPYEGLLGSAWPGSKYGSSIRGQRLEMSLDPGQSYDRVRIFSQRTFGGRLVRTHNGTDEPVLDFDIPHAMFWHGQLKAPLNETNLVLECEHGRMGQIDFYRVEPLGGRDRPRRVESFIFSRADTFPDDEQGRILMAETPRRLWNPLRGVASPSESWKLQTTAFGGFQAITDAPNETTAFDGALVELVVEGLTEPTPARVEIKEPVDTERIWLAADIVLQPRGTGRQTFTMLLKGRPVINMPAYRHRKYLRDGKFSETEFLDSPATGFSIKFESANPLTLVMGKGGTAVKFSIADKQKVLAKAVDDQVEFMREAYAERMEGHEYGAARITTPLVWLAHFAPERMEFRQMWERVDSHKPSIVGLEIPPLQMPEPKNDTGAPEWAFWQMQAMNLHRKHLHWMIDHKQVWTGEFGGVWNDDSTHVENWMGYMLCLDDEGKIRDAMHRYWDGAWNYQLTEGVGKFTQDTCHFSEEGSSSIGMRLLIDYGDPIAYARTLLAASHVQYWLTEDPKGGYLYKSAWVGPTWVWSEGAFTINVKRGGHLSDPLVPLGYLIWYNRHPKAADYVRGLDMKGTGFFGGAYDHATDWNEALKRYRELLQKPVGPYGPQNEGYIVALNEFELTDEARKIHAVEYKPQPPIMHYWGSKNTDQHWWNWKVTGDLRFLVDSYKRVCEWFYSHDWLNGPAQPSMDRNPLPHGSLIKSRIGASAANRGSSGNMWPQYAISYSKGANDVAALVTENLPNQFTVRFYPFTGKPHDLQLRVWRCNGKFEAILFNDKNDDGKPEEEVWRKQVELTRGDSLAVTLPPRQASILQVKPIKTEPLDLDRPDPAISRGSIEPVYGGALVVHVYNNGTKPVEDVLVRVLDARSGEVVINGEQHTGPIEAPLDLRPRFKTVEFKNLTANTWGRVIVEIDPEKKIDDLTRHNNKVTLDIKGTFSRDRGWH